MHDMRECSCLSRLLWTAALLHRRHKSVWQTIVVLRVLMDGVGPAPTNLLHTFSVDRTHWVKVSIIQGLEHAVVSQSARTLLID
jgi:hypothetical protein